MRPRVGYPRESCPRRAVGSVCPVGRSVVSAVPGMSSVRARRIRAGCRGCGWPLSPECVVGLPPRSSPQSLSISHALCAWNTLARSSCVSLRSRLSLCASGQVRSRSPGRARCAGLMPRATAPAPPCGLSLCASGQVRSRSPGRARCAGLMPRATAPAPPCGLSLCPCVAVSVGAVGARCGGCVRRGGFLVERLAGRPVRSGHSVLSAPVALCRPLYPSLRSSAQVSPRRLHLRSHDLKLSSAGVVGQVCQKGLLWAAGGPPRAQEEKEVGRRELARPPALGRSVLDYLVKVV